MTKKSSNNKTFNGKVKKKAQVGFENLPSMGLKPVSVSEPVVGPTPRINLAQERARKAQMDKYAKMSPKQQQRQRDKYNGFVTPPSPINTPYVYTGEDYPNTYLNQEQTLRNSEVTTNLPESVKQAQELNRKAETVQSKSRDPFRNPFSNIKGHDVINLGLYAMDNFLLRNDALREQQEFNRNFRNTLTQTPIYDYNYMYGPDSSGGTQYQNMIMAKQGASIRRGTSPDITNVEVEGGEFIQLPNLSTQHVYGPSHEKGGVHTNLPDGARVFSDHIKPFGSKKTYAQLAKKYDTEKYRKVLDNPYAADVDRNTAKLMFEKNQSILNELFQDQQRQNGNSDGTDQANTMAKFGLDLKKGEKLSFTDPFEYGGVYGGGYAEFQAGGTAPGITPEEILAAKKFIYEYNKPGWDNRKTWKGKEYFDWYKGVDDSVHKKYLESRELLENNGIKYKPVESFVQEEYDPSATYSSEDRDGFHVAYRYERPDKLNKSVLAKIPTGNGDFEYAHIDYQEDLDRLVKELGTTNQQEQVYTFKSPTLDPYKTPSVKDYIKMNYPDARFNYGGKYQDGGSFPDNSTFYGGTYPDPSVLNLGTKVMEEGGYVSPSGKKYKLPKNAVVKSEGDKSIKAGDFVKSSDGTIRKVSTIQAKRIVKASKSSSAKDFAEGRMFLQGWAEESPENAAKLKLAEEAIAKGIKAGQIEEKKPTGWKEGDPTQITIKGNFKPSFKERMAISEVINKTGKGFGTNSYQIVGQQATEGYAKPAQGGNYKGTGSFVGGMTPQDYEQRATYERAISEGMSPEQAEALATTTDKKQKAENRRKYLNELKYDVSQVPDSALVTDDFYKNRYSEITQKIEDSFSEAGFRNVYGDDKLSGWEHYDAASYATNPSYTNVEEEQEMPPGSNPEYESTYEPYPSTLGNFPLYQAAPEALGFMYANKPYSYFTPDFIHNEVAPPTLNIDPQLQAIDDSFQSAIRQNTGNASIGNARNAAMFNQALAAKQQAFGTKQNYDAEARFKADMYNAAARDQENVRDLTAASTIYNDYMAAAQDAAQAERLSAINSLVNKKGQFDRDEYLKAFYAAQMLPNYYYDGTDPRNPLKVNPYNPTFNSKTGKPVNKSSETNTNQTNSQSNTQNTPQVPGKSTPGLKSTVFQAPPVGGPEPIVLPEMNSGYGWGYDNFVPRTPGYMNSPQYQEQVGLYPTLPSAYSVPPSSYNSLNPIPTVQPVVLPEFYPQVPAYNLDSYDDYLPEELFMYGGKIYKK